MASISTVDKILEEVANVHATDILFLSFSILSVGVITYIFLVIRNNKKPLNERRSKFVLFLIALNVSFFMTVLIFTYKVLVIGLKYLFTQQSTTNL